MKKKYVIYCLFLICMSCTDGDKAIEEVTETVQRGAILRTVELESNDFLIGDLSSFFKLQLEEQDLKDGDLLESVEVFIKFQDNTASNGNQSTEEILLETIENSIFVDGPQNLPRTNFELSFQQALTAVGLGSDQVQCQDQFILRFNLKLTDGRNFTTGTASSLIIAFDTFSSSPFSYTINIVEPIQDDLFTGIYRMESILDGPNGPTFVESDIVEITKGRSNTTREFLAFHNLYHRGLETKRRWEFNIVCDQAVFGKNQLSSPEGDCQFNAAPLLLGPDSQNAMINPMDDSVFELWFVEGYLGFDGSCGFVTAPSRVRFSKQ
jgi:hypothetical protein